MAEDESRSSKATSYLIRYQPRPGPLSSSEICLPCLSSTVVHCGDQRTGSTHTPARSSTSRACVHARLWSRPCATARMRLDGLTTRSALCAHHPHSNSYATSSCWLQSGTALLHSFYSLASCISLDCKLLNGSSSPRVRCSVSDRTSSSALYSRYCYPWLTSHPPGSGTPGS